MNELDIIKSYIVAIVVLCVALGIARRFLDRLGVLRPLLRAGRLLGRAVRALGRRRTRRRTQAHRKPIQNVVHSKSRESRKR